MTPCSREAAPSFALTLRPTMNADTILSLRRGHKPKVREFVSKLIANVAALDRIVSLYPGFIAYAQNI
ncbi:MAG: hypothetical protein ABIV50_00685 [Opitutus sp.]